MSDVLDLQRQADSLRRRVDILESADPLSGITTPGGGGGLFLKLDASNDPVTGELDIEVDGDHALQVLTEGTSGVYSFPVTPILDTFTVDGGPPPDANWTTPATAESGLVVDGGKLSSLVGTNLDGQAVWSPLSGLTDTEVYIDTVPNPAAIEAIISVYACIQDPDDLYAGSYAATLTYFTPSYMTLTLGTWYNGVFYGTPINFPWALGDSLGMRVRLINGKIVISVYHKPFGGSWSSAVASGGVSAPWFTSGKIGVGISANDSAPDAFGQCDNFGGGQVPAGQYSESVFNVDTLTHLTTAERIEITQPDGIAPLVVTSETLNTHFNADLLGGQHAAAFAPSSGITPAMLALPDTHLIVGNALNVGEDAGVNLTWDNTAAYEQLTIKETNNPSTLIISGSYLSTGTGGAPNGAGDAFQVIAGDGFGSGAGGGLNFQGGAGGTTGDGGPVNFTGGAGGAGVLGGDILFRTQSGGAGVGRFGFLQPNVYGYLNFSGLSGSNKTFTFPNADGNIPLLETDNAFTNSNSITVATATANALTLKTSDDSGTNNLLKITDSANASMFRMRGYGWIDVNEKRGALGIFQVHGEASGPSTLFIADTSTSRVGVGTDSPLALFHVLSSVAITNPFTQSQFRLTNSLDASTGGSYMMIDRGNAAAQSTLLYSTKNVGDWAVGTLADDNYTIREYTAPYYPFVVVIEKGNTADTLHLKSSNVGINVASPTSPIHAASIDTGAGIKALANFTSLGSGANGDGGSIALLGKSSTSPATSMAALKWLWTNATHLSRTSKVQITAYDTAERTAIEFAADGVAGITRTIAACEGAYVTTGVDLALTSVHHWVTVTVTGKIITLPTAVGISGREYIITATVAGVIVNGAGAELIDGSNSWTMSANSTMQIKSNGTGWMII